MTIGARDADLESQGPQIHFNFSVQSLAVLQGAWGMKRKPSAPVKSHFPPQGGHELRQKLAQIARDRADSRRLFGLCNVAGQGMPILLDRQAAGRRRRNYRL